MEHKEQLLLHLFYFFPSFETQWLEKKQTWNSTCFFHIHTCSPRPRIFNSSLQCQFLPLQRPRGDFSIPKNWLQCSHSYSTSKGSSLILLADLFSRSYTIKSTFSSLRIDISLTAILNSEFGLLSYFQELILKMHLCSAHWPLKYSVHFLAQSLIKIYFSYLYIPHKIHNQMKKVKPISWFLG